MLRIAVPNKGSLAETAAEMLAEAGYTGRRDPIDLHVIDPINEVEFFYLRPKDIATYVGSGALDVGITGRDLLLDARMPGAREIEQLGFGASTFRFAGPPGAFASLGDLEGLRVQRCASARASTAPWRTVTTSVPAVAAESTRYAPP